jgi:hypothetical protein
MSMSGTAAADEVSHFSEHVEPILKRRCYSCHSHSAGVMEGDLTLDWKSGWETGGGRGPAIIPGEPEQSLLIKAIRHVDPELLMPEDKLPDTEIEVLTKWVRYGAADPRTIRPNDESESINTDWWSLKPLLRPAVPANGVTHPIDAFVQDTLAVKGLTAGPRADRRAIIRRMTVDLHGLLPTPVEVQQFETDELPDAITGLVDRLLASSRYGERWARHWMDTIHYADSHGYEHDVFRPNAWRFRDYLVDSFNADKSWSQLIHEQLAADAQYPNDPSVLPAIGFLGAGTYDHSAAATAPMQFENLDRDDLVTQVMAGFVSTTANCARCHAHKFDPITQEDYYSLQAVFAGIGKGDISFDADPQVASERRHWQALKSACETQQTPILLSDNNQLLVARWEQNRAGRAVWTPLEVSTFASVDAAKLERLSDGSILSTGPLPEKETTVVTATSTLSRITAIRLDVLPHESLPAMGPGRAENGNLHLNEVEIRLFPPDTGDPADSEGVRLAIRDATADFDQEGWTIQHAIDGNLATAWGIHPQIGEPHFAVFELAEPQVIQTGSVLHVLLRQTHGRNHIIGRFRLSATDAAPEDTLAMSKEVEKLLDVPRENRTTEQQAQFSAAILKPLAESKLRSLPAPQKLYAAGTVAENERGIIRIDQPREIRVLRRGDVEQPGEVALPGALSAISTLRARFELSDDEPESARRIALAKWLTDPQHPLTWRSIANRAWHYHFGRGLCDTPNDFGRMGSLPSHPELLDWLACELRDSGGSLKRLHRLICTSETYLRASNDSTELLAADPDNRWLARATRQRLDADTWRDSVLLVSGRLDETMGGPGVAHFSTRPGAQLTPILDYSQFDFDSPGATRRSIYRVVWRGIADPLLEPLDFPDLGLLAPVRGFSASPLQALTMMNNRFVLHHAEHMVRRAEKESADRDQQLQLFAQWAWQRDPTDDERLLFQQLADKHGMAAVSRLMLNSNEFLFID